MLAYRLLISIEHQWRSAAPRIAGAVRGQPAFGPGVAYKFIGSSSDSPLERDGFEPSVSAEFGNFVLAAVSFGVSQSSKRPFGRLRPGAATKLVQMWARAGDRGSIRHRLRPKDRGTRSSTRLPTPRCSAVGRNLLAHAP